ncbi:hypothetical protein [Klebsiella michiganensis]|uniref:hypothetical protein n=1 Tax=Klebsiella michiganensis TaxID=1134687 RepID=UPI001C825AA9|nr:hypothetical protein [Klebsiella michiganensis]MDL4402203.1 hypothetical protein [Klebsiella michiganensis]MDL4533264.1 hypothetical protein [Klebsiella michiganensis]
MPKIFDTHAGTDIACEEDETPDPVKDESDSLTVEDLSPVFDLAELTKVSQVVRKSFND